MHASPTPHWGSSSVTKGFFKHLDPARGTEKVSVKQFNKEREEEVFRDRKYFHVWP